MKRSLSALLPGLLALAFAAPALARPLHSANALSTPSCGGDEKKGDEKKKEKNPSADPNCGDGKGDEKKDEKKGQSLL